MRALVRGRVGEPEHEPVDDDRGHDPAGAARDVDADAGSDETKRVAQEKLDQLLLSYTERHPDVTSTRRLLADLRKEREVEVARLRIELEALRQANAELVKLAQTDGLTGLANRRRFIECLASEAGRPQSLALLIVDVDHFKAINDQFGHVAGDTCLRLVAQIIDGPPTGSARLVARLVEDRTEPGTANLWA